MKKLIFGCALAVPALAGLMNLTYVPKAEARPAESCEFEYYADATYTTVVGEGSNTCTGKLVLSWGIKTIYLRTTYCTPC